MSETNHDPDPPRAADDATGAPTGDAADVLESITEAFVAVDARWRFTYVNGPAERVYRMPRGDLIGRDFWEVFPDARGTPFEAEYRRAMADRVAVRVEAPFEPLGGWFEVNAYPARGGGLAFYFRDVGDRRRAEAAVRAGEERLRLALGAARMGVWTLDVATGLHLRDANLNQLLGLDPADTTQPFDDFLGFVHPADRAAVRAAFDASIRDGRRLAAEFRVVRPDGAVRWLRDQGDIFPGREGGSHMAGVCVDVTERRAAEEALRRSEERLRLVVSSATDYAIFTTGPDRAVTSWGPGAEAVFGYTAGEVLGRPDDLLFTPEDRAAGVPAGEAEAARRDGRAADERWHIRRDGSRFWASGVLTPLGAGGANGFVKVCRDLTDRKRAEDDLREARDRLEQRVAERTADLAAEMGRRADLSRRLATAQEDERRRVARDLHDTVGQLLTGLALSVKAVEAAPLPPAAAARLADVRRLAADLGREVHGLAAQLRPTTLDDLGLEAALGQLAAEWAARAGVPVEFEAVGLGGGRLPAEVETVVFRVAQEALTNAARHARATAVSVGVAAHEGQVVVTVEDDGGGFDPESAARGRLGLVGMRERVELAGGALEVESAPGAGTTVIARVPIG